ncbi:hypothetical protein SOP94_26990, partial [Peribacillus frigoritolerans]|uniref:hypothetical protein n=1 Tax=Peribacillus frigoritolerans TaxID=450367 RepID=UPI002B2527E9
YRTRAKLPAQLRGVDHGSGYGDHLSSDHHRMFARRKAARLKLIRTEFDRTNGLNIDSAIFPHSLFSVFGMLWFASHSASICNPDRRARLLLLMFTHIALSMTKIKR